jgi:hypothetical protein
MQLAGKYRSVISDGFDKRIEVKVGELIPLHKIGSAVSFSLSSVSRAFSSTTGSTWATSSSCWGASARALLLQVVVVLGAGARQSSW